MQRRVSKDHRKDIAAALVHEVPATLGVQRVVLSYFILHKEASLICADEPDNHRLRCTGFLDPVTPKITVKIEEELG